MTGFFKKNDDNVHSSTLRSFLKKRLHSQMRPILKKNDYNLYCAHTFQEHSINRYPRVNPWFYGYADRLPLVNLSITAPDGADLAVTPAQAGVWILLHFAGCPPPRA